MTEQVKQKVLIEIKGVQGDVTADNAVEMTTTGTLYEKKGVTYIQYVDTVVDDDIETKTTIKLTEDEVRVIRYGAASSTMMFKEGEEQVVAYDTKFGVFQIDTKTKEINMRRDERSIDLEIIYALAINQQDVGLSKFEMKLKYL